jgi:hypothetical protein
MAIGANKGLMRKLEHESPHQGATPITAGGGTLRRGAKGKMQWKKADSDGVKRKNRGGGIAAIRSKKHKYTPGKKK